MGKIDQYLDQLENSELIEAYSKIITLLKSRGVIRTKNLLGDLAEYLVIDFYGKTPGLPNLQAAPAGTQNVDALSREGNRYSIKATSGTITGVFYGLNPPESNLTENQKFEYVIIACFDDSFRLTRILELTWSQFLKHKRWHKRMRAWNLSVTKILLNDSKVVFNVKDQFV